VILNSVFQDFKSTLIERLPFQPSRMGLMPFRLRACI